MAKYRFGDICKVLNGRAYKQNELLASGKYPILRVGNFFSSDRWYYSDMELPEDKYCDYEDLLFAWSASFGPKIWDGEKVIYHYHIWKLIPNDDIADKWYLYYWLRHSVNRLTAGTHGSVMAHMTKGDMENQTIELPSLQTQRKISSILRTIDEKIHNNVAINNNLEQQAKALFKKWFIDNPENVDWSAGTFRELIQSTLNGDWGKEAPTGNNTEKVYCIRGADIPEVKAGNKGKIPTRYILPKNLANKKLEAGDIVVEISGGSPTQSTGRCTAITQSLLDRYDSSMVCTNFCKAIKPKNGYSLFVYYYWQYLYEKGVFFSYENGTTGIKNLDFTGFIETEPIIIPPFDKVQEFDDYCNSIFSQVFANGKQSEQLASLRDTLLPKLMSGELDVSDIEL
jgi:restriction endonuclease S subunit